MVLSWDEYQESIRYPTPGDTNEPQCTQRELTVSIGATIFTDVSAYAASLPEADLLVLDDEGWSHSFQAWMLECKGVTKSKDTRPVSYFVSPGSCDSTSQFYLSRAISERKNELIGVFYDRLN